MVVDVIIRSVLALNSVVQMGQVIQSPHPIVDGRCFPREAAAASHGCEGCIVIDGPVQRLMLGWVRGESVLFGGSWKYCRGLEALLWNLLSMRKVLILSVVINIMGLLSFSHAFRLTLGLDCRYWMED